MTGSGASARLGLGVRKAGAGQSRWRAGKRQGLRLVSAFCQCRPWMRMMQVVHYGHPQKTRFLEELNHEPL